MRKIATAGLLILFLGIAAGGVAAERPGVTHYALRYRLFPKERRLEAEVRMTVKNLAGAAQTELPFLLYRLLEVESVRDGTERPLEFSSDIVKDADEPNLQVNYVRVRLSPPLSPGESTRVVMKYSGSVFGYPEVWAYVRDTVSEEYSLLRKDSLSYPVLGRPAQADRFGAAPKFTYEVEITVPAGTTAAMGGRLKETRQEGGRATFVYESKVPTWRIDIAAARFAVVKDEASQLHVYVLAEHEAGGRNVLAAMKRVVALYSRLFGEAPGYRGYTAIEIPAGWGSQAAELYFLQTAAAFTDPERLGEVYHEVAHTWNAKPKPEVQRTRWFDEAFASYFESLAVREFEGEEAFRADMEQSRKVFLQWVEAEQRYAQTPIVEYGKQEIGGLSYTKGAWSLYVLHQLLGEEQFLKLMRRLLAEHREQPADFQDFQRLAEQVAGRKLDSYFQEWFYGAESSRLLIENVPIAEILARYE